ncbi:hypothetical protein ACFS4T_00225 [Pseudomonas lini]
MVQATNEGAAKIKNRSLRQLLGGYQILWKLSKAAILAALKNIQHVVKNPQTG